MNYDEDDDPYDWRDDDWDDEHRYVKEEPDCYACNDNGCRQCEPTRFDLWRWRVGNRIRALIAKLRQPKPNDDGFPF